MTKMYFLTLRVACPRDQFRKIEQMPLDVVYDDDKQIPFPCNGCDNLSGDKVCERCRTSVTLAYLNGEMKFSEPFYPETSRWF